MCKKRGSILGRYDVVVHFDLCFLHMFLLEQSSTLSQADGVSTCGDERDGVLRLLERDVEQLTITSLEP